MDKNLSATRREIVRMLKQRSGMTVDEMSQVLGISSVGVRQHLGVLESDALVTASTRRQGLGRPVQVYRLTEGAEELFPHRYDELANSLLDEVSALYGEEAVEAILEARKNRMLSELLPRVEGKPLEERAQEVAHILEEAGCLAEYDLRDGQCIIRECHCALSKVSRRYPQICRKEMEMISALLGQPVTREQHQRAGDPFCIYHIDEPPA